MPSNRHYLLKLGLCFGFILFGAHLAKAQSQDTLLSAVDLKMMSLDQLMDIEVTSVSNTPVKISEVPSAIQVISNEEILRSSAVRLPEAVGLATNVQMTRVNSHDYGIVSRGFNGLPSAGGILANKLLVMSDGRSLYTPILGGVYWDAQNMILQDVDRIEVISGPGGTLWGANAVNGVINIVSKSADQTQGLYVSSRQGTYLRGNIEGRYGFKINDKVYARVYGQFFDQKPSFVTKGVRANDLWENTQAGFRVDAYPTEKSTLTLQGDAYGGTSHSDSAYTRIDGQNILGRFTHNFSSTSDLRVQAYFDRNDRETPNDASDITEYTLYTSEIDAKYRKQLGSHNLMIGSMFRYREDRTFVTPETQFDPVNRAMPLFSAFVQDQWVIKPNKLSFTYGSKILHNVFTGVEVQPSVRLAYQPSNLMTIWAAVSRAVRVPSRFDADITGAESKFEAEYLDAYELGYRVQATKDIFISIATFFNHYDQLRSLDVNLTPGARFPTVLDNNQRAESWGVEFMSNVVLSANWRVRLGYTYFDYEIWQTEPTVIPISEEFEALDPEHQIKIQSIANLGRGWSLDGVFRYSSRIEVRDAVKAFVQPIDSYSGLDLRLAKSFDKLELAIVGRELLKPRNAYVSTLIPRGAFLQIKYSL